jgi:hypothetical protein
MNKYFHIEVMGAIAMVSLIGEWTMDVAKAYQADISQKLKDYQGTSDRVFPITCLKYWSIPSLEVLTEVQKINQRIAEEVEFRHNALLTQKQHLELFEQVVSEFNLENINVEAKAFVKIEDAIAWGESLGYGLSHISPDYFVKLYDKLEIDLEL